MRLETHGRRHRAHQSSLIRCARLASCQCIVNDHHSQRQVAIYSPLQPSPFDQSAGSALRRLPSVQLRCQREAWRLWELEVYPEV